MQAMVELPRYVSHKTVWALKIAEFDVETLTITPAEQGYPPFVVDREYVEKHRPQVGGYFVMYADGYRSFSPMKAFVEGYKRMEDKGIVEGEARLTDAMPA
jgi:hypothetical protein